LAIKTCFNSLSADAIAPAKTSPVLPLMLIASPSRMVVSPQVSVPLP
jgi:hypothetical protein